MSFLQLFEQASEALRERGKTPTISVGEPVTPQKLDAVDLKTGVRMPDELRAFYLELGSGFSFGPHDDANESWEGWEATFLDDYKNYNSGFGDLISEDAERALNQPSPRSEPALLRLEVCRRKMWVPFYGFLGGGDLLCLDTASAPHKVCFHEATYWHGLASTWSFVLAPSFTEFIHRWSRYCFVQPSGGWTVFCMGRTGDFDWAEEHFPDFARPS